MSEQMAAEIESKTILVLGGGIAGMTAALHIAATGHRALVVDEAPAIGGALPLLDKTFPTDSCAVCFISPDFPAICPLFECAGHPRIDLLPDTTLDSLEGEPGDFTARLTSQPRYVDPDRCTACGLCAQACPQTVSARHSGARWPGETRQAIDRRFPQAVPEAYALDPVACTWCGACLEACPHNAIDLDQAVMQRTEQVVAVVLAPGFGPTDAHLRGAYGYGVYPNVITSLEYERMLSTSSPSQGRPIRQDDGAPARRIAIIHCAGSRDQACGLPYCSAGCCMIAAKQASLTVRRAPGAEVAVFTMDVRAAGRGYERYLREVQAQPRITYHRSLISGIKLDPQRGRLYLQYASAGSARMQAFDLVVLQVGMVAPPAVRRMAARLDVQLNGDGFAATVSLAPVDTSRPGVFVAGAFREPKDLAASVVEAVAATSRSLQAAGAGPLPWEELPTENLKAVSFYDVPRIGVFLDSADAGLADLIDLQHLARQAARLPGVVHVGLDIAPEHLRSAVETYALTHVVAGVASARRNGGRAESVAGAPLTWVALGAIGAHLPNGGSPNGAPVADDMLRMAAAQAHFSAAQPTQSDRPEPRAMVIGAGVAGLMAARTLREQGVETHLVERSPDLGGWLHATEREENDWLRDLIQAVQQDPGVQVHHSSQVARLRGRPGHWFVEVLTTSGAQEIPCGALVVATGAQAFRPPGFGLEHNPFILTQAEFGAKISEWRDQRKAPGDLGLVVMYQCAGTRQGDRPYCSKTCCGEALENAMALKALAPQARIVILFRDIVTPGFSEHLYSKARRDGILFLRYTNSAPPVLRGDSIIVRDDVLGEAIGLKPDYLVLSSGIVADPQTGELAAALGLPLTDGFFQAAHIKTRPVDLPLPGAFVAGLAGGPATLEETIEQGIAAGLRAALFLRRPLRTPLAVATVTARLCSGCGLCVQACPANARSIDPELGIAQVDPWLCTGCGTCVAVCPNGASQQSRYEVRGVLHALDSALIGAGLETSDVS